MQQGGPLCGGVSLLHTVVDGKNQYEVGDVLTHATNAFARKGDKLLRINDVETKDVSPEKLVRMLSSEAPKLTLHQASIETDKPECLESDTFRPVREEKITLSFRMAMVREERLEEGEEGGMDSDWEIDHIEDEDEELLMVSMAQTSVTVVRGRGCDPENSCNCCLNGCNLSDVIVAADTCGVKSVCKQLIRKHSERRLLIYTYFRGSVGPEAISPFRTKACEGFSEGITIYYYISTAPEKGAPVVLNFTGTSNFLKCKRENQGMALTIECYDKGKMKEICVNDPDTWPFVFYMSTSKDNMRRFESAANKGWFIQTIPPKLTMGNPTEQNQELFYFMITCSSK